LLPPYAPTFRETSRQFLPHQSDYKIQFSGFISRSKERFLKRVAINFVDRDLTRAKYPNQRAYD
jgi:hypothetical protein